MPRKPFQIAFDIKREMRQIQLTRPAKRIPAWIANARPYVDALANLTSIDQSYGLDSGHLICRYALSNLTPWRGPQAKILKAELLAILDN